jgi:hypothetical protein
MRLARLLLAALLLVALHALWRLTASVSEFDHSHAVVPSAVDYAPVLERNVPTPTPSAPSTTQESCRRVRPSKLLMYAAHSGFGNQELSLRKALLLAYALNRTLVLPPLLPQTELAFGPPEERCADRAALADLQRRAERVYIQQAASGSYEPLLWAYEFGELQRLGMRVVDHANWARVDGGTGPSTDEAAWSRLARPPWRASPIANLSCAKGDRLTAAELRAALRPHREAPLLRLGSVYFLKLNMLGLRRSDPCFAAVFDAVLRLPLAPSVMRVVRAAARRIRPPYASVHLRISDSGVADDSGAEAETSRAVAWLRTRLRARLGPGPCQLYVATNMPAGARGVGLAPLCATPAASPAELSKGLQTGGAGCNCTDYHILDVERGPAWPALLNRTRLSPQSAALLVDQGVCASAARGFFATSKFCGPVGFRRSTFSEAIALRWQLQREEQPLCAHAMEHALLRGMAAHGDHVY